MKKDGLKLLKCIFLIIALLIGWLVVFHSDFIYIFKFWIMLFIVGLVFFPLTSLLFKNFHDRGWIFSKIIGVAVTGWIMWLLSYIKILEYSTINSYIIILVIFLIMLLFTFKKFRNKNFNIRNNIDTIKHILITEVIFMISLTFWVYIRSLNPTITNTTEQFMDYGFMNSIMNSEYMPPVDIWYSGSTINYYYFGLYLSGFICKISFLKVNEGYNLMMAFISSLTFTMPYVIGVNLFKHKKKSNKEIKCFFPYIAGIALGIAVSLGGTLHYPIYRGIINSEKYFYPDETRYIEYEKDGVIEDSAVTEKPAYSNILGDLHAHYIGIVFSFTIIALLIEYYLQNDKNVKNKYYLSATIILIAFLFGIQKMVNLWDYPIYLVIISLAIVVKNIINSGWNKKNILKIFGFLIAIFFIEEVVSFPFMMDLHSNITKVYITNYSSSLYKMLVLWGLPVFCVFTFYEIFFHYYNKSQNNLREYLSNNLSNVFILVIGLCAFGLVLIPEIVYVKDIYGEGYQRFNTMFKLTYEAYILFAICINYIIFSYIINSCKWIKYIGYVLLIINVFTFGYGIDALYSNYKNVRMKSISDSEMYLKKMLINDYNALQWIKENIDSACVVLESINIESSYTLNSRMSVFSGNPTVLGWTVHEWLWRVGKDYDFPPEVSSRFSDVQIVYTSSSIIEIKNIIEKYHIDYIYIGELEYTNHPEINIDILKQLGKVVYEDTINNEKPIYIIDVRNHYLEGEIYE